MAVEIFRALDVVTEVPMLHTIRRPGSAHEDCMLIMSLLGPFQRHFCRVTPVPPYGIGLWSDDMCVVLDMPRGQYQETVRRLYHRGIMFVAPAGMPKTLQELDVASLVTPIKAEGRLDLGRARSVVRQAIAKK